MFFLGVYFQGVSAVGKLVMILPVTYLEICYCRNDVKFELIEF